jgi:hypothetical protein
MSGRNRGRPNPGDFETQRSLRDGSSHSPLRGERGKREPRGANPDIFSAAPPRSGLHRLNEAQIERSPDRRPAPPSPGRSRPAPSSPGRNGRASSPSFNARALSPGRNGLPSSPGRGRHHSGQSHRNAGSPGISGRSYGSPERMPNSDGLGAPTSPGMSRIAQSPGKSQRGNGSNSAPKSRALGNSSSLGSLGQHNKRRIDPTQDVKHAAKETHGGGNDAGSDSQDSIDEWLRCWNCNGPVRMHWDECPSLGCGASLSLSLSLSLSSPLPHFLLLSPSPFISLSLSLSGPPAPPLPLFSLFARARI